MLRIPVSSDFCSEVTYGPTLARSDCVSSPAWEGIGVNDQSAGMDSVRGPCRNCKGSKDPGADEERALAPGVNKAESWSPWTSLLGPETVHICRTQKPL